MPDTRPTLLDIALKTSARIRARGPREVAALVWERVREEISSASRLVVFARLTELIPNERTDLELRRARPDDAGAYARDIGTDSAATFRRRLTEATWCYLVLGGTSIVHATWCTMTAAWTRELRGYLTPSSGHAYVYESFTRADARGRGIYPFALKSITYDLRAAGVDKVWVAADESNHASRRAITKAGFTPEFEIPYRRSWGRLRTGAPPAGETGLGLVRERVL